MMGEEVLTLVNENKPAGIYSVSWDGKDDQGYVVPSGVYFYKLISDEGVQVRKMMKVE